MKRSIAFNYGFAQGLCKIHAPIHRYGFDQVVDNAELNRLLSIVFAADDTGSIQGDIGVLMSDKVDPAIVDFVKRQLLFDTTSMQQSPLPDYISDDDAIELRRSSNETSDQYAERLAKKMIQIQDSLKSKNNEN